VKADVLMIWAAEYMALDAPWMVDAWDEFSIENNPEGWEEAVAKAHAEHPAPKHTVKIVKAQVDLSAITDLFMKTPEVALTGIEETS